MSIDKKWGFGIREDDNIRVLIPCKYDYLVQEKYDRIKVKLDGEEFFINYNEERI